MPSIFTNTSCDFSFILVYLLYFPKQIAEAEANVCSTIKGIDIILISLVKGSSLSPTLLLEF